MNWSKIRTEYINGHISYAKLAKKHGASLQAIKDRGAKEKWVEQREEQRAKIKLRTNQKTVEKISEQESDLAVSINRAATELLNKLNVAIQQTDLFIERTKTRVPKKVQDKKTGEIYTAWQEEESIRLSQKDGINLSSVKQITSALRDLQAMQFTTREEVPAEEATVNIIFEPASPEIKGEEEEDE